MGRHHRPQAPTKDTPLWKKLPWYLTVDRARGILSTTDHGLLCGFALQVKDLAALPEAAISTLMLRINTAWQQLPPGSGLWLRGVHTPAVVRDETVNTHPVAQVLNEARLKDLRTPGALWDHAVTLWFWHKAPSRFESWLRRLFIAEDEQPRQTTMQRTLEQFWTSAMRVVSVMRGGCEQIISMDSDAALTALQSIVSPTPHAVKTPRDPRTHVSKYLAREGNYYPGLRPMMGTMANLQAVRCLSLTEEMPPETYAGMITKVWSVPRAFEWTMRLIVLDRQEAGKQFTDKQFNWRSTAHGWRAFVHDIGSQEKVRLSNRHVDRQAEDSDEAKDEVLSQKVIYGYATGTFVVRERDPEVAEGTIRALETVLHGEGCLTRDEDDNCDDAWFGTHPGNQKANVGVLTLSSLNVIHLGPLAGPWQGVRRNVHLKGPPLCWGVRDGCVLVGVDLHVDDLGLAIEAGPKGSGKSTLNNWFGVQFLLRYERADVQIWDIERSARATTLCMGGHYYDLGAGDLRVQVMARVDEDDQVAIIYQWLVNRIKEANIPWHPDIGTYLMGGVTEMRAKRQIPRRLKAYLDVLTAHANTFSGLAQAQHNPRSQQLALMAPVVRAALQPFAQGGQYGHLMDAPTDELTRGHWITFEVSGMLKRQDVYPAMLELLYMREVDRRQGQPIHNQFNEAWHYFKNPAFLKMLADDIPNWRKKNISGLFSPQSISQLHDNPLTPLLMESCQTALWLPNANALHDKVLPLYEGMGLHKEEVRECIAHPKPKGSVYVKRPDGSALVDLTLPPVVARVCGANAEADHQVIDDILEHHGADDFAYYWFLRQGFPEAARAVQRAVERERPDLAATAMVAADD